MSNSLCRPLDTATALELGLHLHNTALNRRASARCGPVPTPPPPMRACFFFALLRCWPAASFEESVRPMLPDSDSSRYERSLASSLSSPSSSRILSVVLLFFGDWANSPKTASSSRRSVRSRSCGESPRGGSTGRSKEEGEHLGWLVGTGVV